MAGTKATVGIAVTRGPESWSYIYITLGFALTIEAGVVSLLRPLYWPHNLIAYAATSAFTVFLWLFSGWFQNKLLGWKSTYESKARSMHRYPIVIAFILIFAVAYGLWELTEFW